MTCSRPGRGRVMVISLLRELRGALLGGGELAELGAEIAGAGGVGIGAARHPGDALELIAGGDVDVEADRVHDELGVGGGERLGGGAGIALAGLLAVADEDDDVLARLLGDVAGREPITCVIGV